MTKYWTVEISEEKPTPLAFLEMACLHSNRDKKVLVFRDRFNAFKVAQILGARPKPWVRGEM